MAVPDSLAKSVASWMAPLVAPRTVTCRGRSREPCGDLAVTVSVCEPGVAACGTVTDRSTVAAVEPPT